MTGELSQWEVENEPEWAMWKAFAERMGGQIHAFDVYQGPYITYEGNGERFKFWLASEAGSDFLYEEFRDVRFAIKVWPDDMESTVDNLEKAADAIMAGEHPLLNGKCPICGNDLTSLKSGDGITIPWQDCWTEGTLDLKARSTVAYETKWENHVGIRCAKCGHDIESDPDMEVEL